MRNRHLVLVMLCVPLVCAALIAADGDQPKLSAFAPAADILGQLETHLQQIEEVAGDAAGFENQSQRDRLAEHASAVAILSLALALHDEDHAAKQAAPGMLKAAQELVAAKDLAAVKAGLAKLKAQAPAEAAARLKWSMVAPRRNLMKQVEVAHLGLGRNVPRMARRPEPVRRQAAYLAVVAQAVLHDAPADAKPEDLENWRKWSTAMRDSAAAVNLAAQRKDLAAAEAALKRLSQSCDDCHEVFQKE
jgi:hypothetical protein